MNKPNENTDNETTTTEEVPDYSHLPEINKEIRGHAFYPDLVIPELYAAEDIGMKEKIIHAKYFHPAGTWLVAEIEHETGLAFGFTKLSSCPEGAEWGYFSLPELEAITTHGGMMPIERDCYFSPVPFSELEIQ